MSARAADSKDWDNPDHQPADRGLRSVSYIVALSISTAWDENGCSTGLLS